MLIRTQIMLDDQIKKDLLELSLLTNASVSGLVREMLKDEIKLKKPLIKKSVNAAKFLVSLAQKAVKGPGNAEYDHYAYSS